MARVFGANTQATRRSGRNSYAIIAVGFSEPMFAASIVLGYLNPVVFVSEDLTFSMTSQAPGTLLASSGSRLYSLDKSFKRKTQIYDAQGEVIDFSYGVDGVMSILVDHKAQMTVHLIKIINEEAILLRKIRLVGQFAREIRARGKTGSLMRIGAMTCIDPGEYDGDHWERTYIVIADDGSSMRSKTLGGIQPHAESQGVLWGLRSDFQSNPMKISVNLGGTSLEIPTNLVSGEPNHVAPIASERGIAIAVYYNDRTDILFNSTLTSSGWMRVRSLPWQSYLTAFRRKMFVSTP
jgi:hypothetical protein